MDNEQQIVSIRDIPVGQLKLVTQDFIDFSGATRVAVTKQDDENYTVTAHVGAKPLVFISASHRDSAWRDRLKAKLQEQGQLDWWNDSKIEPSSRWADKIEAAIKRARVAVVLLSPDYIQSKTATSELMQLARTAESGLLKLFPIVLFECSWKELPAVRDIQMWSMAKPIGNLSHDAAESELEKIVKSIVELIQPVRTAKDRAAGKPVNPSVLPGDMAKSEDKPTANGYTYGPAGYTPEFCGVGGSRPVADYLGVEALAHRLAELIALRETKLPLAVGLFGNWGSGKSHFMNLMDRHMKKLAKETPEDWMRRSKEPNAPLRPDPTVEGPWCREIVPIYFNAWHYLGSNLWASLITEIFDGLFAHLKPKQDELALMRSKLRDAGGATARTEEEVTQAHEVVRQASLSLQEARAHSESARQAVQGLLDNLRTLLPQVNTPENQQRMVEWLGVSAEAATLSQLVAKHREMASLPGRVREFSRRVMAREGRWWRLGWLAGLLVVGPWAVRFATEYLPFLKDLLGHIGPVVQRALVSVLGFLAWITPAAVKMKQRLVQMESWQKLAEEAQAARPKDKVVIDAQAKVVQAEAAAVAAEAGLTVARSLEQQLTQAVDELRPERRLSRFIEARARSADYRDQLGLESLARRDFQELSDIFADAEALQKKMDELPQEEAEQLRKLGASIDRIVLFVDDLDRCQPEKVVDVLQAVHLLLAYPLFAVVVGVDQRCLKQSIEKQFEGLIVQDGGAQNNERPATSLDYLENIFHIPFHLQTMGKEGFATLIENLSKPPLSTAIPATIETRVIG